YSVDVTNARFVWLGGGTPGIPPSPEPGGEPSLAGPLAPKPTRPHADSWAHRHSILPIAPMIGYYRWGVRPSSVAWEDTRRSTSSIIRVAQQLGPRRCLPCRGLHVT